MSLRHANTPSRSVGSWRDASSLEEHRESPQPSMESSLSGSPESQPSITIGSPSSWKSLMLTGRPHLSETSQDIAVIIVVLPTSPGPIRHTTFFPFGILQSSLSMPLRFETLSLMSSTKRTPY